LQSELVVVQDDQIRALQIAEKRRAEMESARQNLEFLSSPWSPHRIERWVLNQGTRILAILIVSGIVLWLTFHLRRRLISLLINRNRRGTAEEKENRARTLVAVFHS